MVSIVNVFEEILQHEVHIKNVITICISGVKKKIMLLHFPEWYK
jgi:hypothetical protein